MRGSAPTDPLYDVDWINRRAIEVFYVDEAWAREFGGSPGYWWEGYPGSLPDGDAFGPFPTSCELSIGCPLGPGRGS
jgi:hypothetical protein